MSIRPPRSAATEHIFSAVSGWPVLIVNLLLFAAAAYVIGFGTAPDSALKLVGVALALLGLLMLGGYFTLQPNQARVLILFGSYKGTVRESGFHWANPFYSRTAAETTKQVATDEGGARTRLRSGAKGALGPGFLLTKLSLRAHNFSSDAIKVNDKRGNPVEIAAVVVWRVENTAQAVFDVEDYSSYVEIQSESAIRSIASRYAYDQGEEHEITLRGGADEVALALKEELQVRLAKAGVIVERCAPHAPRLCAGNRAGHVAPAAGGGHHRRPQNHRTKCRDHGSHGARGFGSQNVVKLDDERKAAMVSNLLVVLCGNSDASPVINTGTLYS